MRILILFLVLYSGALYGQCLKGDCENGQGTYLLPDGSKFVGSFKDGKIGDRGILYFRNGDKYLGDWKEQKREGKGKLIFASGDEYVGDFRNNRFSGYGEFHYLEGDVYKGQWEDNLPNGEGTYYYQSGRIEKGRFVDGACVTCPGSDYVSEYDEPVFEQEEERIDPDPEHGNVISQTDSYNLNVDWEDDEWEDDEWDDDFEVLEAQSDGEQNTSEYHDDLELAVEEEILKDCSDGNCHNEKGYYLYSDGSRYEGIFIDGQPHGRGVCYYASGDKYVGGWEHHTPHGEGIMYFAEGKVYGAVWEYGQPVRELLAEESLDLINDVYTEHDKEIKVWAVVIGVSRYQHMPVLKYSDDDAYRIYAFLKSPEGGALPDEQIKILIDEDATREKILKMLQHTLLRADDNDVVLMYFSGHGLEGSFVPIDFDGYKNLVEHEDVIEILSRSKARYKMCFADACHSGSMTARKEADVSGTIDKYYNAFLDRRGGTAFMLSSKAEEFSLEDGGLRQGVFSHFLIRGLKGEADVDFDNIVTIEELFKFVHFEVRRYTGNVQTPTMVGRYDHKMPVAVVRE